ncbi:MULTISPECIES: hypothetical protein [Streptomyces]|uniref:hypothetical protein n=1 Tax=Streptomyces TaxID=1883 RepID=UPI000F6B8D77|nr:MULTISPECIES: hypothetical protein [unclassified Streptomyces]AZM89943.1 hypothetical protein D1J60_16945 [Streptomyces sp. W1SF4]RSS56056.1 hypothetical protein EF912_15345 [Streptomyces sp. WAC07061]
MAHAAPTVPRRHRPMTSADADRQTDRNRLIRALLMGLVYGVWAAFIKRQMGPVDAGNVFYGILCGVIFAAVMFTLARVGPKLKREQHAAAYGVFAGIAAGYLHSLTNQSVLRAAVVGLFVGLGVGIGAFYRYYTRED